MFFYCFVRVFIMAAEAIQGQYAVVLQQNIRDKSHSSKVNISIRFQMTDILAVRVFSFIHS